MVKWANYVFFLWVGRWGKKKKKDPTSMLQWGLLTWMMGFEVIQNGVGAVMEVGSLKCHWERESAVKSAQSNGWCPLWLSYGWTSLCELISSNFQFGNPSPKK